MVENRAKLPVSPSGRVFQVVAVPAGLLCAAVGCGLGFSMQTGARVEKYGCKSSKIKTYGNCQRSFNWQSTAFVMRGLWVRLPPLALARTKRTYSPGDFVDMVQGLESQLKQLVLNTGPFGPQEIHRIEQAIAEDFAEFRVLRDAVAELETSEDKSPASRRPTGRLLLPARPLPHRPGNAEDRRWRGAGPVLHGQGRRGPEAIRRGRQTITPPPSRPATTPTPAPWPGPRPPAWPATSAALAILDNLSGAVEQTAEYLYQRGACVAAIGGNPTEVVALFERAVEADRNHAGALFGLALENDRRGNDEVGPRPLRAVGLSVSLPCRAAVEPGHLVRGSPAVRQSPAVLLAHPGNLSDQQPGAACF